LRAPHCGRARRRLPVEGREQLRQAEVGQFGVAILRDENVLGFDVPVDETRRVRRGQAIAHADQKVDHLAPPAPLGPRPCLQRATIDKLRDDVLPTIERADVVDREDVRMIERRERARFTLEAGQMIGVGGEDRGHHPDAGARTLGRLMFADVIDEDSTHHLRRDTEKVRATLPGDALLPHEPRVSLMDERRWLESVAALRRNP